jgi:hypothetical protein
MSRDIKRGEANAAYSHAVTRFQFGRNLFGLDGDASHRGTALASDAFCCGDFACFLDESGEH